MSLLCSNASRVMSSSPGSSSTSRMSIALPADVIHALLPKRLGVACPRPSRARARLGSVNSNRVPSVWAVSIRIVPPWCSTIFLHQRQADAGPGVRLAAVQALEDDEDLVGELLGMPMPLSDTVITHSPSCCRYPRSQSMTIAGRGDLRARNFIALPIRFCHSIVSSVGSPLIAGQRPVRAHDLGARLLDRDGQVGQAGVQRGVQVDLGLAVVPSRPTREKLSRSLISTCIRLAPSTAKPMYSIPRSSSLSPYRRSSSWQNEATLRSGSCRSCEAT